MKAETPTLKSPYPYFGGKSRAAPLIWSRLGTGDQAPGNFVDAFAGSLAPLLGRPGWSPEAGYIETVNDLDCNLAGFWRALQRDPDGIADRIDYPISEVDVAARHRYLVDDRSGEYRKRLLDDPHHYDVERAAWWVWGAACWIGSGWCTPKAPDQLPHLGKTGTSSHKQGVHTVGTKVPHIGLGLEGSRYQGVNQKTQQVVPMVGLSESGEAYQGVNQKSQRENLLDWMRALAHRTRNVRIVCGDWARIVRPSITTVYQGITAVLLDPPYQGYEVVYGTGRRKKGDPPATLSVSEQCRVWAREHGSHPRLRIALCGYGDEHDELLQYGWTVESWKAVGGYGNQSESNENRHRERIWFSPGCIGGSGGGVRENPCSPRVVEEPHEVEDESVVGVDDGGW